MSIFDVEELEDMAVALAATGITQEAAAETAHVLHRCRNSDEAVATLAGAMSALGLNMMTLKSGDGKGWAKHRDAIKVLCTLYLKADGIAKN